jgi:hypothetical protein
MSNKTELIFISENDKNIFDELSEKLDINKLKMQLKPVFANTYNNKIGYHIFKDNEQIYKILVLPKTIRKPSQHSKNENKKAIEEFVAYLVEYYRIKSKYRLNSKLEQDPISSYAEMSFESTKGYLGSNSTEELFFYKYDDVLSVIEAFFQRRRSYQKLKTEYSSQVLKHRVDLLKNIREMDKTKIHQTKLEESVYSEMATIAYGAVKLFARLKLELLEANEDDSLTKKIWEYKNNLARRAEEIQLLLQKRFKVEQGYSISSSRLVSSKIANVFRKKQEHRELYRCLLTLFGVEHFLDDEPQDRELSYDVASESVFFDPAKFYEWYVYDYLSSKIDSEKQVLFAEKEDDKKEITKEYKYFHHKESIIESKPDIIIKDKIANELLTICVIDAKWKNIGNLPELSDVLKLQRDCEVRITEDCAEVYACFVAPIVTNRGVTTVNYGGKSNKKFNFYTLELRVVSLQNFNFCLKDFSMKAIERPLKISCQSDSVLYTLGETNERTNPTTISNTKV